MSETHTAVTVRTTVWECDWCGMRGGHIAGTASPTPAEHFVATLGWSSTGSRSHACPRCTKILDLSKPTAPPITPTTGTAL